MRLAEKLRPRSRMLLVQCNGVCLCSAQDSPIDPAPWASTIVTCANAAFPATGKWQNVCAMNAYVKPAMRRSVRILLASTALNKCIGTAHSQWMSYHLLDYDWTPLSRAGTWTMQMRLSSPGTLTQLIGSKLTGPVRGGVPSPGVVEPKLVSTQARRWTRAAPAIRAASSLTRLQACSSCGASLIGWRHHASIQSPQWQSRRSNTTTILPQ